MKAATRLYFVFGRVLFITAFLACSHASLGNTLTNGLFVHLTFDRNYNDDFGSSSASLTLVDQRLCAQVAPSGESWQTQAMPVIGQTNWTPLTNLVLGSMTALNLDSSSATNPMRFHRAVLRP